MNKLSTRIKIIFSIILLIILSIYLFRYNLKKIRIIENKKIVAINNKDNPLANDNSKNYIEIKNKLDKKPIIYKTDGQSLEKGVGIMEHSVMFSNKGQTILSGHRETYFNQLKLVKENDIVDIFFNDKLYKYRVYKMYHVKEDEAYLVYDDNLKENELVLITCYPIDGIDKNPKYRYIVKAKLI